MTFFFFLNVEKSRKKFNIFLIFDLVALPLLKDQELDLFVLKYHFPRLMDNQMLLVGEFIFISQIKRIKFARMQTTVYLIWSIILQFHGLSTRK